jgi:hypothetical protein
VEIDVSGSTGAKSVQLRQLDVTHQRGEFWDHLGVQVVGVVEADLDAVQPVTRLEEIDAVLV